MRTGSPSCSLLLALLCAALPPAWAGCSRPIVAPSAAIGLSVIVRGDEVSGIFPEFLNAVGEKIGCTFVWSSAPRARVEVLFQTGDADILLPATSSPTRDQIGVFVPMLETRAFLISVASERAPVMSAAQLIERRELRVAMVRGFDYGPAYRDLAKKLTEQGRLRIESNPLTIVRLLHDGLIDVAVLTPITVYGAIKTDPRVESLEHKLRFETLPELQWIRSGIYLSNKSLTPADRALLEKGILAATRSGALMQAYKRTYPPAIIAEGTRPVSASCCRD
jgi:polar amino acid transport system substrate-binding protein